MRDGVDVNDRRCLRHRPHTNALGVSASLIAAERARQWRSVSGRR